MRILLIDIEVSPNTVYTWDLRPKYIPNENIIESSYTLCWSAKWHGETGMMFDSIYRSSPKTMLMGMHELISEADMIIHYNGSNFDVPTINKEFLIYQIPPARPVQELDLLTVVRERFRFPSNKMDYVCQRLGIGKKIAHEGFELWPKCMKADPIAWRVMERYNRHDVVLLSGLYDRLLPWVRRHINYSLGADGIVCPRCKSDKYKKRGKAYNKTRCFQQYQCKACHGWFRSVLSDKTQKAAMVAL